MTHKNFPYFWVSALLAAIGRSTFTPKNAAPAANFKPLLWLLLCAALAAPQVIYAQKAAADISEISRSIDKLRQTVYLLDNKYMDNVNLKKVTEDAIKGILEELDPHSVYIPADEYKKVNEPLLGNFEGIGVTFNILDDTIVVVSVVIGGPSEKVGIMAGDQIVLVDGKNMAGVGVKNSDVMGKLRGAKDTKVTVGIKRTNEKELIDFTITRDKIPLYSIDATYMATPQVGYVKLSRFAKTTTEEMNEALQKLKTQGMTDLILDLRGNGGGFLETAVDLCNEFIGDNKLIVYTEGKHSPRNEYKANGNGDFRKGKLIVLIDEGSASASEIVSGAVQDWDRGLLIGRRTFGKGLVQRPFMLPDSSYIRLTVAHYYTPAGRSIQKPYSEGHDAYQKDIKNRLEKGELTSLNQIDMPDSLKYATRIKQRTVYGGGGVMPDIFVPLDTTLQTPYLNNLNRKGILNKFVLEYVNNNRKDILAKYENIDAYEKNFQVDDALLENLYAMANKEKVERNDADIAISKPIIENNIKAIIARYLWDSTAFYRIANTINPIYKKALETINNKTAFDVLK
jgi:carboxyl-terminal processing protease